MPSVGSPSTQQVGGHCAGALRDDRLELVYREWVGGSNCELQPMSWVGAAEGQFSQELL